MEEVKVNKSKEQIYHFEIIKNFNQLKEFTNFLKENDKYLDICESVKLLEKCNFKTTNIEEQLKFTESLNKVINFTDNFNSIIHAINIRSNTPACNKILEKSKKEYKEVEDNYLEDEISEKSIKIKHLKDKIEIIAKNLNKLEKTPEDKEYIKNLNQLKEIKEEISLIKQGKKKFLFFFKVKDDSELSKFDKVVSNQKLNSSKADKVNYERKHNSTILFNNENYQKANNSLTKKIIELSNEVIEADKNYSMTLEYYSRSLVNEILNKIEDKPLKEYLAMDKLPKDLSNRKLISSLLCEKNKEHYYNFIATSINQVNFKDNTHFERFKQNGYTKTRIALSNFKIAPLSTTLSLILSYSAKFLPYKDQVEDLTTAIYSLSKVFSNKLKEIPNDVHGVELEGSKEIITTVDDMFENNSFTINSIKKYEEYINSFNNVKKVSLSKYIIDIE